MTDGAWESCTFSDPTRSAVSVLFKAGMARRSHTACVSAPLTGRVSKGDSNSSNNVHSVAQGHTSSTFCPPPQGSHTCSGTAVLYFSLVPSLMCTDQEVREGWCYPCFSSRRTQQSSFNLPLVAPQDKDSSKVASLGTESQKWRITQGREGSELSNVLGSQSLSLNWRFIPMRNSGSQCRKGT